MPNFDVFLSHNSSDKPTVRALKQALTEQGLKCWLDEEQLRPGLSWQDLLEQAIKTCGSVAVCIAADGLGPWQDQEMQAALRLAVKDGCPIIPVLLPEAPSKPELPLFLGNRIWVDLRGELDAEGIDRLIWGITGKKPGEDTSAQSYIPGGREILTPTDVRFLDEIFEHLYTSPTLILLAQENQERHAVLEVLRERAQDRFDADQTLYLVPPRNPDADEAEFFHVLGRRAGMNPPAESALAFEDYLDQRLIGGERLFLLVAGLSKCSNIGRRRLASGLRGLSDAHDDALRMVLVGGEGLAELKHAQGDLSLLSHAEPLDWPELNTGDLMELARQGRPPLDLTPEGAWDMLEVTGGHPRLIQETLRCRAKGAPPEACIRNLASSKQIESQFITLTRTWEDAQRIADWLGQDDLGPCRGWISDPLLRRLYWKNLLRAKGLVGSERLVWRCQAIIDAGRRVLGAVP
ncbi:toll/interleukin-1 receptor domain-containing protein [Candidatus Thiosymbion oneisti]|uniref:toll/interleukin-1 receptor domain-containing protein n=1 Tax=Candidatus Thiosymbion oneisti TaxID=589554 RepID=UPI000A7772D9|nr:toll/interleukin-1 receptor domain-containing protein [Candidatus Thiosymbion oneisti]